MKSQDGDTVFQPPSVVLNDITEGKSYTHFSAVPATLRKDMSTECVLGVDEAGRGPVLGIQTLIVGIYVFSVLTCRRIHGLWPLLSPRRIASYTAC